MPSHEELQAVLAAARRVLEAREDQMLTSEEWEALQQAVDACDLQAKQDEQPAS